MDSDELHYIVQIAIIIGLITLACITVIFAGAYIIKSAFGFEVFGELMRFG